MKPNICVSARQSTRRRQPLDVRSCIDVPVFDVAQRLEPTEEAVRQEVQDFVALRLHAAAERRKKAQKLTKECGELEEGTLVLVKTNPISNLLQHVTSKMYELYRGPYAVKERKMKNCYGLVDPDTLEDVGSYNLTQLKLYHPPTGAWS